MWVAGRSGSHRRLPRIPIFAKQIGFRRGCSAVGGGEKGKAGSLSCLALQVQLQDLPRVCPHVEPQSSGGGNLRRVVALEGGRLVAARGISFRWDEPLEGKMVGPWRPLKVGWESPPELRAGATPPAE
ncbi:hypothetical protein LIA77_09821 [Sarocladium implicatum]|nr:hypothetical protein LIA77_09821 [Sarocladium implicatum]